MKTQRIFFDENTIEFIMEALGYDTDEDGYLTKGGSRAKDILGEDVQVSKVAGFTKYGPVKDDFTSMKKLMTLFEMEKSIEK